MLYNGLGTHIVYVKPEQLTVYLKVCYQTTTHQAAMPNMDILTDPLHWLYPLHSLRRLNQTLYSDALQTIVPR